MLESVINTKHEDSPFASLLEHDHYPPSNSPLLSPDQTTTLTRGSELGNVDRNLGGADTNANAIDETANDEHANVL